MSKNASLTLVKSKRGIFYRYFLDILLKNAFVIGFIVFAGLAMIALTVALYATSKQPSAVAVDYSYAIMLMMAITVMIYLVMATLIVFGRSKLNNVDLFNNIKPIAKWKVALCKHAAIMTIGLGLTIINALVFLVVATAFSGHFSNNLIFTITSFFSNIAMLLIFGALFSAVFIYFRPFVAFVVTSGILLALVAGAFIPKAFANNQLSSPTYNARTNQNNLVKIYHLDDKGDVISTDYATYVSNNSGDASALNFDSAKTFDRSFNPFHVMTSIGEMTWSAHVKDAVNDIYEPMMLGKDNAWSTTAPVVNQTSIFDVSMQGNIVLTPIDQKSLFDFTDSQSRFGAIKTALENNRMIREKGTGLTNDDKNPWKILYTTLSTTKNWDVANLNEEQKDMIHDAVGLGQGQEILYDIIAHNQWAKNYIAGLDQYLQSRFDPNLVQLLDFIWNDVVSFRNVFYNNNFFPVADNYAYHPDAAVFDKLAPAAPIDFDFIKERLFQLTTNPATGKISSFRALNDKDVYVPVPGYDNIFGQSFATEQDWKDFINSNNTVNNLQNIINITNKALNQQIKPFVFHDNVPSIYALNGKASIGVKGLDVVAQVAYLLLVAILAFVAAGLALRHLNRKDLV